MKENFHLKIYCISTGHLLEEWQGPEYKLLSITNNLDECLSQTYKVVLVDAFCDNPLYQHAFNPTFVNFNWEQFDLVLIKEMLWETYEDIYEKFILRNKIKNFIISSHNITSRNNLFRPYWFLKPVLYSTIQYEEEVSYKKYMFEALLGSPKEHRFFVWAKLQQNKELLKSSVVTFRDVFLFEGESATLNNVDPRIKQLFRDNKLIYPYVSETMDDDWENVPQDQLCRRYFLNGIDIPWKVYHNTWYSICTETNDKDKFFRDSLPKISEKTGRLFLAKRMFVMFGCGGNLKLLQDLGFKTFNSIIDESYDSELDPVIRFEKAFSQVELLMTLDPSQVYKETKEIREHNFNRMFELTNELKNKANETLLNFIPKEFCS
jgi:hypothetical protein